MTIEDDDDWERPEQSYTPEEAEEIYVNAIQSSLDQLRAALTINDWGAVAHDGGTIIPGFGLSTEKAEAAITILEDALEVYESTYGPM